ncbi:DUF2971 domain-containing protein [Nissabacter sp. SGAir0207]|uniref:DUF2971 domain-containing protein n=1 Tax=Nissabacter sp. SGAir0207 TaxID=2126321 RepID=UPI00143D106C|nr:DUF2971 domain-containing protein [Nissabacter sp. SGAir0207]
MTINIPKTLYKYKSFSVDSLDLLVSDNLYFSDPTKFNDPLDCNPSLRDDINNVSKLNRILHTLVKDNHEKELGKAAAKIKYKGPKTLEKIEKLSEIEAKNLINEISVDVSLFGDDHCESITYLIKEYLMSNYAVGVLSLSENYNCPLMWSHYADQHKGFCIGYEILEDRSAVIHPVDYSGNRFITTSQVYDMLFGISNSIKKTAKEEIKKVILLNKARPWEYEKEYRVIGEQGLQPSSFRLKDVTFGLRFNESAMFSVMRALEQRTGDVNFYKVSISEKSFDLERKIISLGNEEFVLYPRDNQGFQCQDEDLE